MEASNIKNTENKQDDAGLQDQEPLTIAANDEAQGLFSEETFDSLGLSVDVLDAIAERGYRFPTPVQARCIPMALSGTDLIVRSKTGTGKTAAFGIPLVECIEPGKKPSALILAPTRELALQGAEEVAALGKNKNVRVCAIYGGASMQKQIDALQTGVDVIVGTPGRVMDQMRRGHLDLSSIKHKVLDEADEMLSMGFFEDVCRILDACPKDSQTLLFSATVCADIEELIENYAKDPETLLLSGDEYSVDGISNILYETRDDYPKPRNLLYLVEFEQPAGAIVFCNTRDDTSLVAAVLNRHGWQAEILNSDLSQNARESVMRRVKAGELRFMVATDLAARGIDISGLTHVINYSMPEDPLVYMHRVGRTGRIGRGGTAISLMGGKDLATLSVLEKRFGVEFERRKLPDPEVAREKWTKRHLLELQQGMEGSVFEAFLPLVKDVKERPDGDFILAFALKYFFESRRPQPKKEESSKSYAKSYDGDSRSGRARSGKRSVREKGARGSARIQKSDEDAVKSESNENKDSSPKKPLEKANRLYVGLGSDDGLDADGVRDVVCEAACADSLAVISVDLKDGFSFVTCRDEDAARALLAANSKAHNDKELKVEVVRRTRRKRPPRRKKKAASE